MSTPFWVLFAAVILIAITFRSNPATQPLQANARIVAEFDTVMVPVPKGRVPAGTLLTDITYEYIAYPRHQLPDGVIRTLDGLAMARTAVAIPAKVPLYPENITQQVSSGNVVVDQIPAGMRAITVPVDVTVMVEGWAGSGAVVDVLLIEDTQTTVVAEQVQILSSDSSVQPVAAMPSESAPSTATLLVTQEQALAITTALPRGRITFALRNLEDRAAWHSRVYTPDAFRKGSAGGQRKTVKGFVSVREGATFALSDGKWVTATVKPQGFFVNTPLDSEAP